MTLRDQRQQEFAREWINQGMWGILYLCPRFGKIFTSINIMEEIRPGSVLVAYPDRKIKKSWEDDFQKRGYDYSGVTFTTHVSLKKHAGNQYDLVILDEVHLLSDAQLDVCRKLFLNSDRILGLTGTLSTWTEKSLVSNLGLPVVARYPIEQAVREGVITDYEITVFRVPLDNVTPLDIKGKKKTEKRYFDGISWVIDQKEQEGKDTFFLKLSRMRVIQNSLAKLRKTRELLNIHKDERVLVFCGITRIADALDIPSFHSKSTEKELFRRFAEGEGNHMAVVKIGNSGVTFKPLDRVIINYFDSNPETLTQKVNRATSFEYNNPEKKARIYIISTDEEVELRWLKKSLSMFNEDKIKYV